MLKTRVTGHYRSAITAVLLLMVASLTACKADSNYFTASNSSIGNGDGSTTDPTAGFQIRLKRKAGIEAFLHKFGDVKSDCSVPAADLGTPSTINCMLNMMEYDVWFYGYEYEIVVPPAICKFIEHVPHRYFSYEPGQGPSTVRMVTLDGALQTCLVDGLPSTVPGACGNAEAVFSAATGEGTCAYDHSNSSLPVSPPNCCTGKYRVRLTKNFSAPDAASQLIDEEREYGGKIESCVSSAYRDVADWPTVGGMPATVTTGINDSGYVASFKIPGQSSIPLPDGLRFSTFRNAGFYGWAEYASDPATWAAAATPPMAFGGFLDRGAGGAHTGVGTQSVPFVGDGSATISCRGPAGEALQTLKVYTNEWNTIEDYTAFKESGDATAVDPNRTGTAGADCLAINGPGTCNSIWGFDDLTNATGGGYVFPQEITRGRPN